MELLSVKEVCEVLKLSRWTITKLVESGQLKASKIGGTYRFRNTDVEQLIEKNTVITN